jgi:hypothetical protein
MIALSGFTGEIPILNSRTLPPNAAQIARNSRFRAGILEPIPRAAEIHDFGAPVVTAFKDGVTWLGWESAVDVARGPIAQDRLYYTGDGVPKMRVGGDVYPLALPAPTVAPDVVNSAAPSTIAEAVFWAYTWVTEFDEESPPSPLSDEILVSSGITQTVDGFGTPPAGRGVDRIRLYRTQTSATGATDLFFAGEIAVATTSFAFDAAATPLQEAITTRDYDPPPASLSGLISLPNGMMAAFDGKEVYFSEPYRPHAWPEKYVLAVDFQIVALVGFASSVAILTSGTPYVAQGFTPETMTMEKMEVFMPCLSRRAVVDIGTAAFYPSVDGLAMISGGGVEIVTRSLFSREQWAFMSPETMVAQRHEGKYLFTRRVSAFGLFDCGGVTGWPELDLDVTLETPPPGAPDLADYPVFDLGDPFSAFGDSRLGVLDLTQGNTSFSDSDEVSAVYMGVDPVTSSAFLLDQDGVVYEWERPFSPRSTLFWRSRRFTSSTPRSYGAVFVRSDAPLADGDAVKVRIYGDGQMIREITQANRVARLPGNRQFTEWEVEIEANIGVVSVLVGYTPEDVSREVA